MAIERIKEVPFDRELEQTLFGVDPGSFSPTYVRRFYVLTDDIQTEQKIVLNSAAPVGSDSIPNFLDEYSSYDGLITDPEAVVTRRHAKQVDDNPFLWVVLIYYGANVNMTDYPADISIGFRKFNKAFNKAFDDDEESDTYNQRVIPILMSNNDPVDPPLEDEQSNNIMRVTRYEDYSEDTEVLISTFQDSLNKLTFRAFAPTTGKLNIGAERALVAGTYYYRTTYDIEHKRESWYREIMNRGYRKLIGGDATKVVNIIDPKTLARVAQPVPLKGNGDVIVDVSEISYKSYLMNKILDWTILDIASSF